jgi:tetratricopeptide (TPR) repeat protein
MEDQPKQFNTENSPMIEAYELLGANSPKELDSLYNDADQELMKSNEWDYNNPDLIINKVKNIIENVDENSLTEEEKEWRQMILWFWYHHAMSIAMSKFGDKEKAKEFGAKAIELNPEDNSNKITEIYYMLLNDKLAEAEELAASIPEGLLDDGNLNPEPQTARDLIEDYKKGMFK